MANQVISRDAVLVDTKPNPVVAKVGSLDSDSTVITSGVTQEIDPNGYAVPVNVVVYQVVDKESGSQINADSDTNYKDHGNVISCTKKTLKVILKGRTKYKVRTKAQSDTAKSPGAQS